MRESSPETTPTAGRLDRATVVALNTALTWLCVEPRQGKAELVRRDGSGHIRAEWTDAGCRLAISDPEAPFILRCDEDLQPLDGETVFIIQTVPAYEWLLEEVDPGDLGMPAREQADALVGYLGVVATSPDFYRHY